MRNRWDDRPPEPDAGALAECVHGSRLLGAEPSLVLHGGGNTSVKTTRRDVTGTEVDVLHVKGSGWDLATIEPAGFAPLRLSRLRALLHVERLSDAAMMNELRCALLDARAPDPSVETLLHAFLPFAAVQHSHADVILTLTNSGDGAASARAALGEDVLVVDYCMPGFDLARLVATTWEQRYRPGMTGMVLLNHGLFTFGDTTQQAYDRHVDLISRAERYLAAAPARTDPRPPPLPEVPPAELAQLRSRLSAVAGRALIVGRHTDERVAAFVARAELASLAGRGPATPDHVIRTKRVPLVGTDVDAYAAAYRDYFAANAARHATDLQMLDPAPRVVLDPALGMLSAGTSRAAVDVARDIYWHTIDIITAAERLHGPGGYAALPAEQIFDVEYWELEQAKLHRAGAPAPMSGRVALVTGAASGIGRGCAAALLAAGAGVIGVDVADGVTTAFEHPEWLGIRADVTDAAAMTAAVGAGVEHFGGVDVLVACAGVFGTDAPLADLDATAWRRAMAVNADSVAQLFALTHPLLALAPGGGRVVVVASRNVPAPGRGAGAYSASKAALTQLARVAALEWADDGIRVNVVHPDAVFDTGLWTPELLEARARRYGMSVEQYRRRNLLHTEITSADVGGLVAQLVGPAFAATTGAQIPIDGGNERVV